MEENYKLTIDFIMIIGKYLKNNNDYINLMKSCKKFKGLTEMYYFNPISDISLFINIQTQHFYNKNDLIYKKKNLYRYIYWYRVNYDDIINKNKNKIFKRIILKSYGDYDNIIYPKINIINGNCILPNNIIIIDIGCFFNNKNLLSINLPNTLKEIKDDAFVSTKITNIIIPEGVIRIGSYCFQYCSELTNIILPSTLKQIGFYAFSNTKITSIIIPEGITKIPIGCFFCCIKLTNIKLPSSLKEINNIAFSGTNITKIQIPSQVTKINNSCFMLCKNLNEIIFDYNIPKNFKLNGYNLIKYKNGFKLFK